MVLGISGGMILEGVAVLLIIAIVVLVILFFLKEEKTRAKIGIVLGLVILALTGLVGVFSTRLGKPIVAIVGNAKIAIGLLVLFGVIGLIILVWNALKLFGKKKEQK